MSDGIQPPRVRAPCKRSFPCGLILLDFLGTSGEGNMFDAFYVCQQLLAKVAALNTLVEKICFNVLKMSLQIVKSVQK